MKPDPAVAKDFPVYPRNHTYVISSKERQMLDFVEADFKRANRQYVLGLLNANHKIRRVTPPGEHL